MSPNIKDVAKKAGVSISSVSRVVNGYEHVSEAIKGKVELAISELNYHPNRAARSLVSSKSGLIGVLVPDLTYRYYAKMISSIEDVATKNNYSIIVCNIKENLDKEKRYIGMLTEFSVDGIILMHEKINADTKTQLQNLDVPVVLASVCIKDLDFPNVNIDDCKAAYDATKYLIDLGHENIAMITGDLRDITAGRSRLEGYKKALKERGIPYQANIIGEGDFTVASGYSLMKSFLVLKDRPTALFAASDAMAIGAMNCAIDLGYNIPEDISFIGFDNVDIAEIIRPRLTTVEQPAIKIGEVAFETLLKMIRNEDFDKNITMKHKIIKGGSCSSK